MDSTYSNSNFALRRNYLRANSLPLFNISNNKKTYTRLPLCTIKDSYNKNETISPELIKIRMMEDYIKYLQREKNIQKEQINTFLSYQYKNYINKLNTIKALNELNSTTFIPVNILPNNTLLLTTNNLLHPIYYSNELDKYYNIINKENEKNKENYIKYHLMKKIKKKFIEKEKKINKYKNDINSLKNYIKNEKIKNKINKSYYNNIYIPLKQDINNIMNNLNKSYQKSIENNNIINNNINEIKNEYDEIKHLFKKKIANLKMKQKNGINQLKNNILNQMRINQENEIINKIKIDNQIDEEIRNQREFDNIKRRKELDEIKRRYDLENLENNKIIQELRFQDLKNDLLYKKNRRYKIPCIYPMSYDVIL